MPDTDIDIAIVGGGLVGASLALALAPSALKIAVIEAYPFNTDEQPSYDERTIALTYRSKQIFDSLGIWHGEVEHNACAIKQIHISNRGHAGIARLHCDDVGTPALGHVVPTRSLGRALENKLRAHANIQLICPASATDVEKIEPGYALTLNQDNQERALATRLLVIADGGRSPLLKQLNVATTTQPYAQSALLSIVSLDRPHQHQAYERFTPSGPLALLPMTEQRYAVVWTLHPEESTHINALDDAAFIAALQATFGYRAGIFSRPSPRKIYPLSKDVLSTPVLENAVIIGNAAHKIHPVAGQGFNLGLRDVAQLANLIQAATASSQDFASSALLQTYQDSRTKETQSVMRFTDGLIQLFSNDFPPLSLARNAGLALVEHCPPAKRFLLRRTMGLASAAFRPARSSTHASARSSI